MFFEFFKYHSNGNDFIIVDNRKEKFLSRDQNFIKNLCHRKFQIGADGVILLQESKLADYKMEFFNSDGKKADMCGNGLLCFVKFIFDFVEKKESFSIDTQRGVYKAFIKNDEVSFYSKLPKMIKKNHPIELEKIKSFIHIVDSGVMHGVMFLSDIDKIDVFNLGKKIRNLKEISLNGINVNFCEILNDEEIKVRVYEKGVENETHCCSTGALAVFFAYNNLKNITKGITFIFKGGKIKVIFENSQLKLIGQPNFSFRGFSEAFF